MMGMKCLAVLILFCTVQVQADELFSPQFDHDMVCVAGPVLAGDTLDGILKVINPAAKDRPLEMVVGESLLMEIGCAAYEAHLGQGVPFNGRSFALDNLGIGLFFTSSLIRF